MFSPFYLVPDSYSRPQTRESVESAKKCLEYESFEYESRLDTALSSQEIANCKTDKADDPSHDLRHHDHGPQEQALLVLLLLLQEGVQGRGAQEGAAGQREAHERAAPVRQGGQRAGGPPGGATLIQGEK